MFFQYKSGRIYFTDSGAGDVIILLHGYLESSAVWNSFAQKLQTSFRVISIDLPGSGLSDIYGDTHSMEFMATAIDELIGSLGLKKVFLTGHSLGGYVTLAFLELFHSKLSGYCLFHSQPFADTQETREKRKHEIELVSIGKKELFYTEDVKRMFATTNLDRLSDSVSRSISIASQIPGEGIIAVLNGMMLRPSRLSVMEEGRVPCLWILGSKDNYIPCDNMQDRVKLPSNAAVVVLNNSGHMGFIEEADRAVKVLTEFIKEWCPPAPA